MVLTFTLPHLNNFLPDAIRTAKGFFALLLLALFFAQACNAPRKATAAEAPLNILLITADDLGLQLGCYGDSVARTPNLDRFARQAVLFRNAYVTQASCSPSRSSMLTGLYPHQNGQVGLSHLGYQMFSRIQTLPQLLKAQGYASAIIGKLHIGPESSFPFDYADLDARKTRDVAEVAAKSGAFMDTVSRPFFLMVNYFDPHVELIPQVKGIPQSPFTPEQVKAFAFQGVDTPAELTRIANYYSCIQRLDAGVELLLQALTKAGKAENTLVVFLGDHGPPFVRAKTACYEAGLKIPFLVRWPGKQPRQYPGFVNTTDLVPTLAEAARIAVPGDLPGRSLKPVLEGKPFEDRPYLFGEFTAHAPGTFYPMRSVRDKQYKLIVNYLPGQPFPSLSVDGDGAWQESRHPKFDGTPVRHVFDRYQNRPPLELYDLTADPNEFTNLAGDPQYEPVITRLRQALVQWQQQTGDPLPDSSRLTRMVEVHRAIEAERKANPDYKVKAPIEWTDY